MRRVNIPSPPAEIARTQVGQYLMAAMNEITLASGVNDPAVIASDFTIENYTETRSLDVNTATTTDLMNFVATLILDLRRGGAKKG